MLGHDMMPQDKPRVETCPRCGSNFANSSSMISRSTQTGSDTYGVSKSLPGDDLLDYLGLDSVSPNIKSPVAPHIAEVSQASAAPTSSKVERTYSHLFARRTPSAKHRSTFGALKSRVSQSQGKKIDPPAIPPDKPLAKSNPVKSLPEIEPDIKVQEKFQNYRAGIRTSMRKTQDAGEMVAPDIGPPMARKSLRTYHAFTIRKARVTNLNGEKASWARAETVTHNFSEDEISKKIRNLSKTNQSAMDKQASLSPLQRGQIKKLLADLEAKEGGKGAEWTLCQLQRKGNKFSFTGIDEGESITVFLRRTPGIEVNPIAVTSRPNIKPLRHPDQSIEKTPNSKRKGNSPMESPEKHEPKYRSKAPLRLDIPRKPVQGLGIAGPPPGVTSSYPKNKLDRLVLGDKSARKDDVATVSSYTPSIGSNARFRDDVSISTCSNGRGKAVRNQPSSISARLPKFSQSMTNKQYGPNMQLRPVAGAYEIQT